MGRFPFRAGDEGFIDFTKSDCPSLGNYVPGACGILTAGFSRFKRVGGAVVAIGVQRDRFIPDVGYELTRPQPVPESARRGGEKLPAAARESSHISSEARHVGIDIGSAERAGSSNSCGI